MQVQSQAADVKAAAPGPELAALMLDIGHRARAASRVLARTREQRKNAALAAIARNIRSAAPDILAANAEDVRQARQSGATAAFLDRLSLDPKRIEAMAAGVEAIAQLP